MSGSVRRRIHQTVSAAILLIILTGPSGCGKKGPPLPPLRLVPAPVNDVSVQRLGNGVHLRFTLPTSNLNGPGPIDLDRVEIYAMTVAAGSPLPPMRDLLGKANVVGSLSIKPPPPPGEQPPETEQKAPDPRPAPGDRVSFVDELTPQKLKGQVITAPAAPASETTGRSAGPGALPPEGGAGRGAPPTAPGAAAGPPATPTGEPPEKPQPPQEAAAEAKAAAARPYPIRVYAVRGLARGGRTGQPSSRLELPIIDPPAAPTGVAAGFTPQAVTLEWIPPVAQPDGPPVAFNIYRVGADAPAINVSPEPSPKFEAPGADFGVEQCFTVRAVLTVQNVAIESDPSERACVTPRDIFPPAAPQGLSAITPEGAIGLTWDANSESDLAGYQILRADAPGETLRPVTPELRSDTSFRDDGVTPGVTYVYVVVAVDRAGNASARSGQIEVTAR